MIGSNKIKGFGAVDDTLWLPMHWHHSSKQSIRNISLSFEAQYTQQPRSSRSSVEQPSMMLNNISTSKHNRQRFHNKINYIGSSEQDKGWVSNYHFIYGHHKYIDLCNYDKVYCVKWYSWYISWCLSISSLVKHHSRENGKDGKQIECELRKRKPDSIEHFLYAYKYLRMM